MPSYNKIAGAIKKNDNKKTKRFGTVENGVGKKVAYMSVPAAFATLPQDSTVVQTKKLNVTDVKGGKGFEIYVLACSKKHEYQGQNGKRYVQNWYVSHKRYFGGKPAFDQMLYQGTSKRDAAHRFASLPYHELRVKLPDSINKMPGAKKIETKTYKSSTGNSYSSKWALYTSDGTYAAIARNRSERYQARANKSK